MAGYGSDDDFDAWLEENGYTLPEGAAENSVLRQRGSAYLDALYALRWPGLPTGGYTQERAWPQTGATLYGAAIPSNVVPPQVIRASYHAALYEAQNPGALSVAVTPSAQVKREKVEGVETEYFEPKGDALLSATPLLSAIEGLIGPLVSNNIPAVFVV